MALREILQNIRTFFHILQQSRCRAVEAWTVEDVNNALNWAAYCEKIHDKSRGKPYQSDMDLQIRAIKEDQVWFIGNTEICLDLLKDSSSLVRQSLLQNPWLPGDVYQSLMDKTGADILVKDLVSVSTWTLSSDRLHAENYAQVPEAEIDLLQKFVNDKLDSLNDNDLLEQLYCYLNLALDEHKISDY